MEKPKKSGLMTFGQHLVSTVSVAMVLFMLGIVGLMGMGAYNIRQLVLENLGFNVVMSETATEADIAEMTQHLADAPYVSNCTYMSSEDILREEEEATGIDVTSTLGFNPYTPEFNVHVTAEYASVDSINSVIAPLITMSGVGEVVTHEQNIRSTGRWVNKISLIFICIAGGLLLISFVIINNTVRLTIYSKRFLLNTMQLVGATPGFIRRPLVVGNMLNGVIAGLVACLLLSALRWYLPTEWPEMNAWLPWGSLLPLYIGVVVLGMIICGVASWIAANKYLRQRYDEMFKK